MKNFKKVRKRFPILLVAVLTITVLTACGSGSVDSSATDLSNVATADDTVYEFSLAHQWPPTDYLETELVQRWIKEVDTATDGHVKIKSYPGNTLTAAPENYEGVVQGIADIGMVPYSYTAGRFPVVEAFMLPGFASFNNAAAASYALNEAIGILDPEELHDTQHLFSFSTGENVLLSNVPIRSMEDMKGLSLGVTQAERATMIELLGATPVSLPVPEWYEALQKNLIVGGIMSPEALKGHRLAEVTGSYVVDTGMIASSMFYCVMNKDKFDALPPAYQAVLTQVPDYFAEAWDSLVVEAIQFDKELKDVEIITLSDAEKNRWRETISPIVENNLKSLNERGLDGDRIHQLIKELEEKYNAKYPYDLSEMVLENA